MEGTLFLDEIGDMQLQTQTKILRAIQEGEIQRVGATKVKKVMSVLLPPLTRILRKWFEKILSGRSLLPPERRSNRNAPLEGKNGRFA